MTFREVQAPIRWKLSICIAFLLHAAVLVLVLGYLEPKSDEFVEVGEVGLLIELGPELVEEIPQGVEPVSEVSNKPDPEPATESEPKSKPVPEQDPVSEPEQEPEPEQEQEPEPEQEQEPKAELKRQLKPPQPKPRLEPQRKQRATMPKAQRVAEAPVMQAQLRRHEGEPDAKQISGAKKGKPNIRNCTGYGDYGKKINRRIKRLTKMPRKAKRQRLSGMVTLGFYIRANGEIERSRVLSSSGHDILDQAALNVLERASPLPRPPKNEGCPSPLPSRQSFQFRWK